MKYTLGILYFLLNVVTAQKLFSQADSLHHKHFCGTTEINNKKYQEDPAALKRNEFLNQAILQYNLQKNSTKQGPNYKPTTLYTIPCVVHIIHQNGPENISDAQVVQQINDLNESMRNTGFYDPATGVDVEIEFCLARQDSFGNFTTGINRIVSTLTSMYMETEDVALKSLIQWNPYRYMNIWVVKDINSVAMGPGVAAYAYYPSSHGKPEDGIVCEAAWFGVNKDDSKIMTHEVGHYLDLKHTFEGGCTNNNCLTDNDKVCDTPPDGATAYYPCSLIPPPNTCATDDDDLSANNPFRPTGSGGLGDQADQIQNYMDYGNKVCQSVFTQGQKDRMVPALLNARVSLLASKGCLSPCANPLDATFTYSPSTVTVNSPVSFTNNSTGTGSTIWILNNSTVFSNASSPSYTFTTVGVYTVTLMLTNGDSACTDTATIKINVRCNTLSTFTTSATQVSPGDNVSFTNTTSGGTSYQWFVDGNPVSTSTNYSQVFNSLGGHTVYMVSFNGNCYDTSYVYIQVGSCGGKEANHWYFGYKAGVDFSSGTPVADLNGKLWAYEGCATISDKTGNLLFYTDGDTVWTKNHTVMTNGTNLQAGESATQSSIILQKPKSQNLFYVFTVPCCAGQYGGPAGLAYSIVDMSLGGGLGAVIQKNTGVLSPTPEKVTAVRHANGCDYWILSHLWNSDKFYAYQLSSTGLITTPVITAIGEIHKGGFPGGGNSAGHLKVSADGSRIALALQDSSIVEVFDFDNSTGIVSNAITLKQGLKPFGPFPYGLEFSPDGTKLYETYNVFGGQSLQQFDLMAGNAAAILASRTPVGPSSGIVSPGALQLGPDGKIYLIKIDDPYLGVINVPNAKGMVCNYVHQGVHMGGRKGYLGLPNFMPSFFTPPKPKIQGPDTVCLTTVPYSVITCDDTIKWTVQGSATLSSPFANPVNVTFTNPGTVTLIAQKNTDCGIKYDTLMITAINAKLSLGNDTALCSGPVTLTAPNGFNTYSWNTGVTNQTITASTPGNYWVTVTSALGCALTDTIKVSAAPQSPTLDLGNDTIMCPGKTLVLNAGPGFASYKWQDFDDEPDYTVTYVPGKYWVTVTTLCGTKLSDTINVTASNTFSVNLKDTSLCTGGSVTLDAGTGYQSYIWNNQSSTQTISVSQAGTYWVYVTNAAGCYASDSAKVSIISGNTVQVLGKDSVYCAAINATLDAGNGFNAYTWSNGSTTQSIQVTQPGIYWVEVANAQGCSGKDSITISSSTGLPENFLGSDTVLCKSEKITLKAVSGFSTYQWQDGATGNTYIATDKGLYWVLVTNSSGCSAADSLNVELDDCECAAGIPNAFSPNGDGANDILYLRGNCIKSMHLVIYNRWGEKMLETTDLTQGWDGIYQGKPLDAAVFVYYLQAELYNNTSISRKGNVSLVK